MVEPTKFPPKMKPGERMASKHGDYVRQEDVHDVAARATPEAKGTHIMVAFDRFVAKVEKVPEPIEIFGAGFDAGEGYGHTIGFSRGAIEATKGLTVSKGRSARQLFSGNYIGTPETKLDALNQEQLTAEVGALLAQYAIVATDLKVAAVLDALNTLPGVDIKFGERDRGPREQS